MKPLTLVVAVMLLAASAADADSPVSVIWTARAATVVKTPFGRVVPLNTPITGYFTFDLSTHDDNPSPFDGEYQHEGTSAFVAEFLDAEIRGSGDAFYWVDLTENFDNDTFRIYDGPRNVGFEGGIMSLDGVPDEDVEMFLAVTDDAFDDDDLIDPFPFYTFGFLGTTHTFSLEDEDGTILLQFTAAREAVCGDPNGGGTTSADALQVLRGSVGVAACYACTCDVDASGTTTASDALKVLRFAVGTPLVLECSACA